MPVGHQRTPPSAVKSQDPRSTSSSSDASSRPMGSGSAGCSPDASVQSVRCAPVLAGGQERTGPSRRGGQASLGGGGAHLCPKTRAVMRGWRDWHSSPSGKEMDRVSGLFSGPPWPGRPRRTHLVSGRGPRVRGHRAAPGHTTRGSLNRFHSPCTSAQSTGHQRLSAGPCGRPASQHRGPGKFQAGGRCSCRGPSLCPRSGGWGEGFNTGFGDTTEPRMMANGCLGR